MEQSEIKQLLQREIFHHPSAKKFNSYSQQVLRKLSDCHTVRLGMHVYGCNTCAHQHYQYHSCGNRHCPNCGGLKREQWLQDRRSELLPTSYLHIVFTLPQELRSLVMGNRKALFNLLFEASTYTLRTLGKDEKYLGGTPGIISVLHTNGQDLTFHPHVHCIVTGGGLSKDEKWIPQKREKGNFLFPRRAMEKIFKGYFLDKIKAMLAEQKLQIIDGSEFENVLEKVRYKKWNVYAKAPFSGPEQIVEYLGRYTHKVAISTNRIEVITDTSITFKYKDYRDKNQQKKMTLSHEEFLRRFEQHILPQGFVKIRHSGFLSHQNKGKRLAAICEQLNIAAPPPKLILPVAVLAAMTYGKDITQCSVCKTGKLELRATYVNIANQGIHLVDVTNLQNRGSPRKIPIPA
ncbi:MAG TPA: IS91 family transposase [Edaphocola sp.]|nr:IS91 family transposase [Edaphocola sp.]